jgi:WD40 repeat protein
MSGGGVRALEFGSDGKLYAGGNFNTAGGSSANYIAKWDGANWSALGTGMSGGNVSALEFGSDGMLYAGGAFTSPANRIARWDGANWSALRTGMDDYVNALAWDGTKGWLYVGGEFTTADKLFSNKIGRWETPVPVNITSSVTNGVYGTGAVIPISIVFSEAVNVTGTPRLTLETGATDAVVNYSSGSGTTTLKFNYTVATVIPARTWIMSLPMLWHERRNNQEPYRHTKCGFTPACSGTANSLGQTKQLSLTPTRIIPIYCGRANALPPQAADKVGIVY